MALFQACCFAAAAPHWGPALRCWQTGASGRRLGRSQLPTASLSRDEAVRHGKEAVQHAEDAVLEEGVQHVKEGNVTHAQGLPDTRAETPSPGVYAPHRDHTASSGWAGGIGRLPDADQSGPRVCRDGMPAPEGRSPSGGSRGPRLGPGRGYLGTKGQPSPGGLKSKPGWSFTYPPSRGPDVGRSPSCLAWGPTPQIPQAFKVASPACGTVGTQGAAYMVEMLEKDPGLVWHPDPALLSAASFASGPCLDAVLRAVQSPCGDGPGEDPHVQLRLWVHLVSMGEPSGGRVVAELERLADTCGPLAAPP